MDRMLGRWVLLSIVLACIGCAAGEPSNETADRSGLRFTDVTEAAGISAFRHDNGSFGERWAPEIVGGGGGFVDYNGDGWLDLLLVGGGTWPERRADDIQALWLYENNRDGTFRDVTAQAGLADVRAYGFGITAADYDNDGDEDVFLTTLHENLLFRNDNGVFVEVGEEAGVQNVARWSTSALFFDADNDGFVDLYVGNYVDWTPEKDLYCAYEGEKAYCTPEEYPGVAANFYRNNGDGTFADRTAEASFLAGIDPTLDKTLGVAELDFNNDGWTDLVVANDTERDLLYQNNGDGTFTERGMLSGIAVSQHGKARAGMGIDVGVVDASGEQTMLVGNFSEEMVGVYQHTGNGLFLDRATVSRIGHKSLKTLTFGLFLFDADLDGDLDLFTANGHVQNHIERMLEGITFKQAAQLYLNDGTGVFEEINDRLGGVLEHRMVGRGAAYGDYDRDGDLDVLVVENDGPAHLWRNEMNHPNYLHVVVAGTTSNRDGLGTRIIAVTGNQRQERRIRTGGSFLSQSDKAATFGFGTAEQVDSLYVYWPSGQQNVFTSIKSGHTIYIDEGRDTFRVE